MSFTNEIIKKAQSLQRSLVLPETTDIRILQAAHIILEKKIARSIILVGNKNTISQIVEKHSLTTLLENNAVKIYDPLTHENTKKYSKILYELRKSKGMTEEDAYKNILDPIQFGAMLVKQNDAYAMVAGAMTTTADVLRAALRIIQCAHNTKIVSSCFIMETHQKNIGNNGLCIFSDCAIIPQPSAEELAYIAYGAAQSCKSFLNTEPHIAMLSFSTKGSASHAEVEKVIEATNILRGIDKDVKVDGELQFDAAIHPDIAKTKAPQSNIAGHANVFVFPDLASGNIGYKIAQQIGGANAYGPFIQGLSAPVSDLSRGCSVEDIVISSAVTLCQERQ